MVAMVIIFFRKGFINNLRQLKLERLGGFKIKITGISVLLHFLEDEKKIKLFVYFTLWPYPTLHQFTVFLFSR